VPRWADRLLAGLSFTREAQAELEHHWSDELVDRNAANDQGLERAPQLTERIANDRGQ
jgi:hypothetical protein